MVGAGAVAEVDGEVAATVILAELFGAEEVD